MSPWGAQKKIYAMSLEQFLSRREREAYLHSMKMEIYAELKFA